MNKQIIVNYQEFENDELLSADDKTLLETARKFTSQAYAPYSKFFVAASVLLDDGLTLSGTNQENASFPVGMCAERSLLATIANVNPTAKIVTMAISYHNKNLDINNIPCSPCGMCRQALLEWEQRQQQSFRIILSGQSGAIYIFDSAKELLPLSFSGFLG